MTKELLKAVLFTPLRHGRWGLPCLFLSAPGAAKTDIIKQTLREWSFPGVMLSPGTHGEGAFGVTPVPYDEFINGVKQVMLGYPPPSYIKDILEGGVIFLDELLTAPPALQPPMLGFLQDRRVGFYEFHARVRIIAASNPAGLGAGGYDCSAPVANRMGWVPWDAPSEEEWGDWLISHGGCNGEDDEPVGDAKAEEARVMAVWPEAYARAAGLVRAFHRRRNGLLSACPAAGDPKLAGPWPSHRTWEYATRALATCSIHGLNNNERDVLIQSFVGEGARDEFQTWCDKADLPEPADVLDGKEPWKHEATRLDRTYAVLSACVALVLRKDAVKRNDRASKLWEMIGEVDMAGGVDVTEPIGALMAKHGLHTLPAARPVLVKERDLLRRAGIGPAGRK